MSSSPDFVRYICEQLEGTGAVRARKMFGEYMVYVNDRPIFLVCDDTLFIKMLPELNPLLDNRPSAPPYDGAKEHYVLDPDDRDMLRQAAVLAEAVTPLPKKKTKRMNKSQTGTGAKAKPGPIPWHVAWPSHMEPSMADIAAWIDSPVFGDLTTWVEETYGVRPAIEYSRCSLDPGWNVKYKLGSKALCALYPRSGFYTCMVSVGAKLIPDVETLLPTFTPELRALYEKTSFFQGGKWLLLDITDPDHLEDVRRLMCLKAKPPRKKP